MIVSKTEFILNASVQPKDGRLYLVYSHYDPVQKKTKPKWKAMGLSVDAKKSVIEKRKREMMRAFEEEEYRLREGWTDPSCYPLINFLNEWADKSHSQKKIQSSTYASYKRNINGHIKLFFGEKVTLADSNPSWSTNFTIGFAIKATANAPFCTIIISCMPRSSTRSSRRFLNSIR